MSERKLLIIGYVWVDPNASAAGSRMLQLIEVFLAADYKITFASATINKNSESYLNSLGIDEVTIRLNHSSFDTFLAELMPDVVLFDRFMVEEQFGWRVTSCCPNAIKLLDTEDFHSLRKAREEALKLGQEFEESDLLTFDLAKREIAAILRCDLTIMISSYEVNLLERIFRIDKELLVYVPFLCDPLSSASLTAWTSFDQRKHFTFIGNCLHPPNVDAIIQLKTNIWPIIRAQLPKAELHIYVAHSTQQINQLHDKNQGFLIMGPTRDPDTVVQNIRVVLAPLRFGAGQKGKLIEAMRNGAPSVTTSIGAEGMHGALRWNGFIEDQPRQFAERAIALYTDNKLWSKAQANGVSLINELYDKQKFGKQLTVRVEHIFNNVKAHRKQNFLGGLLQHHTLQSTKYMSKWIEAKNS